MGLHGAMKVNDFPSLGSHGYQPTTIQGQNFVITAIGLRIRLQACRERSGSDGLGIKDRWRYVNDVGSGRFDPFVQTPHAHLEGLEARFMIRVVNTAIHSVTGEHNLRLDGFEGSIQAFVQVGSWKGATGMTGFGEARDGFTGQSQVQPLRGGLWKMQAQVGFDVCHIMTSVSDAVTEYERALGGQGLQTHPGPSKQRADTHLKEEEPLHGSSDPESMEHACCGGHCISLLGAGENIKSHYPTLADGRHPSNA